MIANYTEMDVSVHHFDVFVAFIVRLKLTAAVFYERLHGRLQVPQAPRGIGLFHLDVSRIFVSYVMVLRYIGVEVDLFYVVTYAAFQVAQTRIQELFGHMRYVL